MASRLSSVLAPIDNHSPLWRLRGKAQLGRRRLTVLVTVDGYHVQSEAIRALAALGHRAIPVDCTGPIGGPPAVLRAIAREAPDLLISINYVGFDRLGWLDDILARLELPCAIWLVDSPLFFAMGLLRHRSEHTELFAWDQSFVSQLQAWTGRTAEHLPLGCEPALFAAARARAADDALPISFVGSSMVPLTKTWRGRLSPAGARTGEQMADRLLADRAALHSLVPDPGPPIDEPVLSLAYANCLASRRLRRSTLAALPAGELCVFGDVGWQTELPGTRLLPEVGYGAEVGHVYRRSAINVNATILQMPTAVNQRVFDVPAAGGFLLTDAQSELFSLFVRDEEVVAYERPEELPALCRFYGQRPRLRADIAGRARARIEQEHTYLHRLDRLIRRMRRAAGRDVPLA